MQTLFSLSRQSMSNTQRVQEVEQEIDRYAQETDELEKQYNERYLNKAQISVKPEKLEETISNMQVDNLLPNIKVGSGGIIFAVEKKNNTFAYYPNEKIIGRSAVKYGLEESQLTDDYNGYLTLGEKKYFASSVDTGDYYIYAAVPEEAIGGKRLPITVASVFASFIALAIVFLLLTVGRRGDTAEGRQKKDSGENQMIDVTMPDGTKKKSRSAASRFKQTVIKWNEKTAEQKMFLVLKWLLGILSVVICLAVVLQEQVLDSHSIFKYVISGRWARGLNIFAVTAALLIICVAVTVTAVVQKILYQIRIRDRRNVLHFGAVWN